MKLIIDIPKEEYEEFKKSVTFLLSIGVDFSEMRQYMLAIANGMSLEQFVNKLRKEIEDLNPHDYSSYCSAIDDVLEILDKSMALKALEQEPILDKIYDEISHLVFRPYEGRDMLDRKEVLQILDKCKAESEQEMKNNRLEKAKEIIKAHFASGGLGLFDTRNSAGDPMSTIYKDDELTIDICYRYEYFEVFGLTDEEFSELEEYYENLAESEE